MNSLSIDYPPELLWALQQEPEEFETEARLLLAVKLVETGQVPASLPGWRVSPGSRSCFCSDGTAYRPLESHPTN